MAIQRRPFSRLLRHAGDTEDVFSTLTPGVLTGALAMDVSRLVAYFLLAKMYLNNIFMTSPFGLAVGAQSL